MSIHGSAAGEMSFESAMTSVDAMNLLNQQKSTYIHDFPIIKEAVNLVNRPQLEQ